MPKLNKIQAQTLRVLAANGGQATTKEVASLMDTYLRCARNRLLKLKAIGLVGVQNAGSWVDEIWHYCGTDDDIQAALGIALGAHTSSKTNNIRRVTLGRLDGVTARGDCPEGVVRIDGRFVGIWGPKSQNENAMSHEFRTYGYSALVEINGAEVEFRVVRTGCTERPGSCPGWGRPYVFGATLEAPTSAKARLRRLIAEAL